MESTCASECLLGVNTSYLRIETFYPDLERGGGGEKYREGERWRDKQREGERERYGERDLGINSPNTLALVIEVQLTRGRVLVMRYCVVD